MNAHTEHNATLAGAIRDDAGCSCSGQCVNGKKACSCGLDMPMHLQTHRIMPAEACTDIGADEDYPRMPSNGRGLNGWELFAGVLLFAVLIAAVLGWPDGFVGWGVR